MDGHENSPQLCEIAGVDHWKIVLLVQQVRMHGVSCDLKQRVLILFTELGHDGVGVS